VLWITAHDLLTLLFTEVYGASVPVFRIWLGVLLLAAIPAHGPLRVLDDTRFLALQTLVKLVVVAVFTLGFLSAFGLPGAVLIALGATLIGKSMLLSRLTRRTGSPLARVLPWRSYAGILFAGAAATVPAVAVRSVASSSIDRLVLAGTTYLIAYAVIVWCCGMLDRSEKQRVLGVVRRGASRSTDPRPCRVA
jgi:hypothetical protein